MLKLGLKSVQRASRSILVSARFSSSIQPTEKKTEAAKPRSAGPNEGEVLKWGQDGKLDIESLPKNANDNFLIEFKKRKPSYDQIFEYQIDEKKHLQSKPIVKYALSPEVLIFMHKKYDLTWAAFKRMLDRYIYRRETNAQQYQNRRHGILGPDLATAHFILNRGGKVRFLHKPDVWVLDRTTIPNVYDKTFRVISVDASNVNLMYEGLDNFILLNQLEELHLAGNHKLDDFACDKLARLFRNSTNLKYLDLSDIPQISHRGIEALCKIRSLKTLIIKGTKAAKYQFVELLVLMFNEVNPQCRIIYK